MSLQKKINKFGTVNMESTNDLSYFRIEFYNSSAIEEDGYRGICHLIEHLMCAPIINEMTYDFNKYSIYFNAYTSSNEMCFYISGLDEYITKYKYDFLDKILSYEITEDDFIREKEIVIKELNQSFSDQSRSHHNYILRKNFNYYSPIGNSDDIKNITFEKMIEFKNKYYSKPNRILNISKYNGFMMPYNYEYSTDVIKKDFVFGEYEYKKENDNKYEVVSIRNICNVEKEDITKLSVLTTIYCNGFSTPLYEEIRMKRSLCYNISFYVNEFVNDNAFITFSSLTSYDKKDELNDVFLDTIEDDSYITQEILDDIKLSYNISERMSVINDPNSVVYDCDDDRNIFIVIETITIDELKRLHKKYFNRKNFIKSEFNGE